MAWSEVGPVATEDLDPLPASIIEVLGDEMGDICVAPTGHTDVRGGRACAVTDDKMGSLDGVALGTMNCGGVGELDMVADVRRRKRTLTVATAHPQAAVVA